MSMQAIIEATNATLVTAILFCLLISKCVDEWDITLARVSTIYIEREREREWRILQWLKAATNFKIEGKILLVFLRHDLFICGIISKEISKK